MVENMGRDSMWQAISTLLSDWHTEAAEIELRNELPGGEIHAAWHLRFGGRITSLNATNANFCLSSPPRQTSLSCCRGVKPLAYRRFMPLAAIATTVSGHGISPPRPLDAHNAFLLGQHIAHLHQWSDQPQFGLDFDNDLSTTPQPNAWQRRWSTFFAEQRIGWQLELAAEKGLHFGDIDSIVDNVQQRLSNHQPQPSLLHGDLWSGNCALGPNGPYIFDPACYWGDRECDLAMLPLHPEQPPQIYDGYQSVSPLPSGFLSVSRFISSIRC
jgi:fructosamine-3-kinase